MTRLRFLQELPNTHVSTLPLSTFFFFTFVFFSLLQRMPTGRAACVGGIHVVVGPLATRRNTGRASNVSNNNNDDSNNNDNNDNMAVISHCVETVGGGGYRKHSGGRAGTRVLHCSGGDATRSSRIRCPSSSIMHHPRRARTCIDSCVLRVVTTTLLFFSLLFFLRSTIISLSICTAPYPCAAST